MHTDIMKGIKVSDMIHTKRVAQNNTKHKLTLKFLLLCSEKFMILSVLVRFTLVLSSSVSSSPLAFLKNTSLGSACVEEFDDINDDSVYKCLCELKVVNRRKM